MRRKPLGRINYYSWAGLMLVAAICAAQVVRLANAQVEAAGIDPTLRANGRAELGIQRAAEMEASGQIEEAERELLAAAEVDRRFGPAWALTNFYHRQHQQGSFRFWLRRAAEMSYGDRTALFQLVPSVDLLPVRLRSDYASFLISAGRLQEAEGLIAGRERNLDLTLADRFLAAGDFRKAVEVWNRFRTPRLESEHPLLVNGDFRGGTSGLAFDWRLGAPMAVTVALTPGVESPGQLEIHFSGGQRDSGELASQYLLLEPGRSYQLSFDSRSMDLPPSTGLRWIAEESNGGANLLAAAPELALAADWRRQSLTFSTGPKTDCGRLALTWRRATGAAPLTGAMTLRNVQLEFAP